MKTLAERLAACREDRGLTQTQLAKNARLKNQSIIGSLESGHRKSSSYIPAIADALGVNSLWLASGKGKKELNTEPPTRLAHLTKLLADHPEISDYVIDEAIKNVDSVIKLLEKTKDNGTQ
jgi:transcriptional regulator with XRE-family HTH domain